MEDKRKDCKKKREEVAHWGVCPFCMYHCPYMGMMMNQNMTSPYQGMMMNQNMTNPYPGMMSQRGEMNMRQQPCDGFVYTVRQGDTLYTIAQRYRITLNDLVTANPQLTNPNNLTVGQTICVPGVTPLPTPVECTNGEIYTVRSGDTLYAIARRFNVTVSEILAVNPIITNPNNLVIGWNLCIPTEPEEPTPPECIGETYTIRAGDTLYALSRRFDVTIAEILEANPLITDPDNLIVGLIICIPGEEPTPPECTGEEYVVRAGDTLFAIARRFNVTVSAILAVNPLITDPNNLIVGLRICIPSVCTGRIYVVRAGDTMAGIALNSGVSYQALLDANPQITDPNQIFIGQNICIPQ